MWLRRVSKKSTAVFVLFVCLAFVLGLAGIQGRAALASEEAVETLGEVSADTQSSEQQNDQVAASQKKEEETKIETIDTVAAKIAVPVPGEKPVAKATASAKAGKKALPLLKVTSVERKDEQGNAFDGKFELGKKYTVSVKLAADEKNPFDAKKTKVAITNNNAKLSDVTPSELVATYTFSALKDPKTSSYSVKVTDDGNGEAAASALKGKTGDKVILKATPKEGFEFDKWEIVTGESAGITTNVLTIGTGNVTVKAVFSPLLSSQQDSAIQADKKTYSITLDKPENGEIASDPLLLESLEANQSVTLEAKPNSGYTFSTWKFTLDDGSDPFKDTTIDLTNPKITFGMPAGNMTASATFAPDTPAVESTYNVTVTNDEGGQASANPTSGKTGDVIQLNAVPNAGYLFDKWDVTAGGITIADVAAAATSFTMGSQDVQIVARFKVAEGYAAVTFNANGGTGTMAPQVVGSGETVNLTKNAFTREGYTFTGWNTKADGSGTSVKDEGKVKVNSNVTLYAQWSDGTATYTISFSSNGGSGSMDQLSVAAGESVNIPANKFSRSGYTFNGWNTKQDGSGTAYGDQATFTPTQSMVLYATWKANPSSSSSYSSTSSNRTSSSSSSTLSKTGDSTPVMPIVAAGTLSVVILASAYVLRKESNE